MKRHMLAALVACFAIGATAQQVTTIYFLENAPMRHTINPAFQPVSRGYINFTPIGWMSYSAGNNSLTVSDVFFKDPKTGMTITPIHPNADKTKFLNRFHSMLYTSADANLGILNMGFRVKEKGYVNIGINQRIEAGVTTPKTFYEFFLGGGMQNLNGGMNTLSLTGLGTGVSAYTEISGGYSHQINDQWTVGGKLKVLLGQAYVGLNTKALNLYADPNAWQIGGKMRLDIAGPINAEYLSQFVEGKTGKQIYDAFAGDPSAGQKFDPEEILDYRNWQKLIVPAGFGAALDLGFVWKPIEYFQVSAALTDLGFIYWSNGTRYECELDSSKVRFEGAGAIEYSDYLDENGKFSTQMLMDTVMQNLKNMLTGVSFGSGKKGIARMTSARLNIGLDANFWDNRIGVGVVSATRLYNARLYEEVTFGLAFRPVHWFNIAATYSLMNNGKYSNIGAGLGFMPYDGINLTIAMDYIPTSYAKMPNVGQYVLPDKTKMFNFAMGVSICWGSNRTDKDKDGVWDKIDMCPETPRGVAVDEQGCPVDEDHDGVPDYQDNCLGTPAAAIGYVDNAGCPLDTDGDGIPDYRDLCPNTPIEAIGLVDTLGCPLDSDLDGISDYMDECPGTPIAAAGKVSPTGCPLDTDGDGIPDYLDLCPNTPEAARTSVDANGCAKDTDGDGVEDWQDECPNTPAYAIGHVDEKGCPKDSDGDGVPDYSDQCPNTPAEAIGHVDAKGCELDSDADGVFDYMDECPQVAGLAENKGCPEVKREVRQLLQKAMQGIEFESGKATIKSKSYPLLDQIADIFIENENYIIEIQGHTDNTGKEEVNKKLSQARAEAVKQYLVKKGVAEGRMTAIGYGQELPIADNKTAAGRQKNRRVEFNISFEEVHYETVLDHAD